MSTPPSPADLGHLAARLQQRRDALRLRMTDQLAGVSRAEHAREVLLQDGDDAPQRSSEREVDLALTDIETVELNALDAALQRMAEGRYGLCEDCGTDIPAARLAAEPEASLCIDCQRARERGRAHGASL